MPAQQAELLKIVQEDKLARLVEGKNKAALTLQRRVDKAKEDLDAKFLRAQLTGAHGDETKAKTAEIKLRHVEEDLAWAKQERDQSVAASEVLFAVECCTCRRGLEYYLFSKGLTDSLRNSWQRRYTSAHTRCEVVSQDLHPNPVQPKDMTVTRGISMTSITTTPPRKVAQANATVLATPPPTRSWKRTRIYNQPDSDREIQCTGVKIGGVIMADLGLLVGPVPFAIKLALVDENKDGSDSEVKTFTVAPSTFMAINASPKKGSSSSTRYIDTVLKRSREEDSVRFNTRQSDANSFDPEHPSFKRAQPVMIEEVYAGDSDDETDRKKGERERTFKDGVSKTMDQFRPKFPMIMDYLLASESNPTISLPCSCGEANTLRETVAEPRSGFTFAVLRDFHLQTLTSKKSAYDYISAIRRKTNNAFCNNVPDVYTLFLHVQRIWVSLTMFKRSGQVHGIEKFFPSHPRGSVTVPCFSCPERGFNVSDAVMDTVTDEYQHLVQLFLMQDGHFGLQRFHKVNDPDDMSLLPGAGFFPRDSDYLPYEQDVVATSDEKSTCLNFNALEMQNKLKFKGCMITGVVAVECGHHCMFLSMVDLHKGKWFANGDYTLAMALRRYTQGRSLMGAKYFQRIVLTYDVAWMGRSHGEGIEPSWAETKQSGGSTRQMNHGHHHDKLNDFHNFWNWLKVENMCEYLTEHLTKGREKQQEMVDFLLGLSVVHGEELVTMWEQQYDTSVPYMESVNDKKKWTSPYRLSLKKLPTQHEVFNSLTKHEDIHAMDNVAKEERKKNAALLNMIDGGIKLQIWQRELKSLISKNEVSHEDTKKL
ncbi:hypothetical protein IW262DRAFT_1469444 [Armillaria fumosa]|nr:hypothetical protein IW262DRAFT_1469444 [Armillaria fumosa]